jgi:hypothetical protein
MTLATAYLRGNTEDRMRQSLDVFPADNIGKNETRHAPEDNPASHKEPPLSSVVDKHEGNGYKRNRNNESRSVHNSVPDDLSLPALHGEPIVRRPDHTFNKMYEIAALRGPRWQMLGTR